METYTSRRSISSTITSRFKPPSPKFEMECGSMRINKEQKEDTPLFAANRQDQSQVLTSLSAQVVRERGSTGATLRSYVLGPRLLSFSEGGNVRYYHADGLGSTRLLTETTGAVADRHNTRM